MNCKMSRLPQRPPMEALRRQMAKPRRDRNTGPSSGFVRETFTMTREEARAKAREWFENWPKAAYWTEVESWRQLSGDTIEFTMRRLPTAD